MSDLQQVPTRRSAGWVPFALIAVVIIPGISGVLRLIELFGGPHVMPDNPRMNASPAPVVIHVLTAILYAVLGAFQFSATLRRRRPGWHRAAGRVSVVLGLCVAISALWMTLIYAREPGTGTLVYLLRLTFASALAASITLGLKAIRSGDVPRHRAWMTRAYALALGAGTQVFTQWIGLPLLGAGPNARGVLLGAGWVINLAIAEYVIGQSAPPHDILHRSFAAPANPPSETPPPTPVTSADPA